MLKFCSLYSGSSGNSFLVQKKDINILIDAGVSGKKIEEALTSINVPAENITAIIISHEHIDHTRSVGILSKKYNIPVYANQKTWQAMPEQKAKIDKENRLVFKTNEEFKINNLKINPFNIPHDAEDPCGFSISDYDTKITIATDIGHINKEIINNLKGSTFLFIESNYEKEILKYSKYPYKLKSRIASDYGHLSNEDAGKTIAYLSSKGTKNFMLGHLSMENNFPELAYKTVCEEIENRNIALKGIDIKIAERYKPSKLFEVG